MGLRFVGRTNVTFRDVGTIAGTTDPGDLTSEMMRTYNDGTVFVDTRFDSDGFSLPDDGRTNRWFFNSQDQVVADDSAIAFHSISSLSNGASTEAESSMPGIDVEFSQRWGRWGRTLSNESSAFIWGGLVGVSIDFVNAKSTGTVMTSLHTVTDLYSLDGAAPPTAPYAAPSSQTVTIIDSSGNPISSTIDTTTFLLNRPYNRTESTEVDGAEVTGFWQVHGGYLTARAGLWARWNLSPRLSVRASAGVSYSVFGLDARFDEWISSIETTNLIRSSASSETQKPAVAGYFATLDGEVWMTRSTGFFASLTYDQISKRTGIAIEDRLADLDFEGGVGARFGLTYRF